jgi:hypothetical protein
MRMCYLAAVVLIVGCVSAPNGFEGIPQELLSSTAMVRCTKYDGSVNGFASPSVSAEGCQCVSVGEIPGVIEIDRDGCTATYYGSEAVDAWKDDRTPSREE